MAEKNRLCKIEEKDSKEKMELVLEKGRPQDESGRLEKEIKTYERKENVTNKRKIEEDKLIRHTNKVKRLSGELEKLKINKISTLTVPVTAFAGFSLALLFASPIALTAASTLVGAAGGYRFANDIVKYKMLNKKDSLLLERLFPAVEGKAIELDKATLNMDNCKSKVEDLTHEEEELTTEHKELHEGVEKLKEIRDSLYSLHIKKLNREYLPYHTDLQEILSRTIEDLNKFYTDICRELTDEEKRDIAFDITNKTCQNCQNEECTLTQEEKEKMSNCVSWYNEVEIGKSKVLRR